MDAAGSKYPLAIKRPLDTPDPKEWDRFHHHDALRTFMRTPAVVEPDEFRAAAMFTGAALGEYGFRQAGFGFLALLEKAVYRAHWAALNHPEANVVEGDANLLSAEFIAAAKPRGNELDLLSLTAPCQGMSTAGRRLGRGRGTQTKPSLDARNRLSLVGADIAKKLRPRVIFIENVQEFEMTWVKEGDRTVNIWNETLRRLGEYKSYAKVVDFAHYGVPQRRKRFVGILVRKDQRFEPPEVFPDPTHGPERNGVEPWPTARNTLQQKYYNWLDGGSRDTAIDADDPLHHVPTYDPLQYTWIKTNDQPGRSAYRNPDCLECGQANVPFKYANCPSCRRRLPRPTVSRGGRPRLIIGHHTSYRRMFGNLPVPTITTSSGHFGSDTKIHPYQNRVLSIREVLDHQTVPAAYCWDFWTPKSHWSDIRESVGEAVPSWFSYRVGRRLRDLL